MFVAVIGIHLAENSIHSEAIRRKSWLLFDVALWQQSASVWMLIDSVDVFPETIGSKFLREFLPAATSRSEHVRGI